MTSKRIFLFVLLATCLISCSIDAQRLKEPRLIKKAQTEQQKRIPKSLHYIRRNLKSLLSSLIKLQEKVEKQCPIKLEELASTIERIKILLDNVKSKDPISRVKEKDLDLIRIEVQNFILSVRREIEDQEKKKKEENYSNSSKEMDLLSEKSLETKKGKSNLSTEVREEFEILEKKVLILKEGLKNLLNGVEVIKTFLSKCGAREQSSSMIAIQEKLCDDVNGIYLKANESIYHVSLIEDEFDYFLSDEEYLSSSSLRSLRSDIIIEEEELEKLQRKLDQFLSVQKIIPNYLFSCGAEKVFNQKEYSEIIKQEDVDLLRQELKDFSQQFQQMRIRIQSLQDLDASFPMLKHLEEELSTTEQELKCFRSCLETGLEEFLNTGKIATSQQQILDQKKEDLAQKSTKLKQVLDFIEEQVSIEQGQIQGMHLIGEKETLCLIAEQYGVFIEDILRVNPNHNEPFKEGDLIKIPVQKEIPLSTKEKT